MKKTKIKLAIVDDHKLFREGLINLLKNYEELLVNFEAVNGQEFFNELALRKRAVDVLLLDLEMPVMDGMAVLRKLRATRPDIRTLVLTRHNEDQIIYELVKLGAMGFLQKDADIEEVVDAIYKVYASEPYFNADISVRVVKKIAKNENRKPLLLNPDLSPREKDIVKLMCLEFSTKEIATKLFLSQRTIESHRSNIFEKTKSRNLAGVVMYAVRTGLAE